MHNLNWDSDLYEFKKINFVIRLLEITVIHVNYVQPYAFINHYSLFIGSLKGIH